MQFPMGPACIFLRKGGDVREGWWLRGAFLEFDKDHNGFISYKDLWNLMRTMGCMSTEMALTELGQQISMNFVGRVDSEDFVELMTPKLLAETAGMIGVQELRNAFKEFDAKGDGEITLAELQQAMQRLLGDKLTPREIAEVVQEAHINGNGTVDFEGDALGSIARIYIELHSYPLPPVGLSSHPLLILLHLEVCCSFISVAVIKPSD
uniref:Calcium binding protein 5 n=1 Tax=Nannospalax galili TaxID=1026970 RepID=A0A8C6QPN6_NANGA